VTLKILNASIVTKRVTTPQIAPRKRRQRRSLGTMKRRLSLLSGAMKETI